MAIERDDSLQYVRVRLDGKNYSYLSYVMRNFLKGNNCGDILVLNLKVLMRIMPLH